jgi:hypothetical protein
MNGDDFRTDLEPTRGQLAHIAREWTRIAGEAFPTTRYEATELLLRLRRTPTPDPAPEPRSAAQDAQDRATDPIAADFARAALEDRAQRVRGRGA